MGMSRRKVVLWFYGVTLVFLAMGFAAYWSRGQWIPVLMGAATLLLLVCGGRLHFARDWFAVGRVVGESLQMRQETQYALTLARWLELEGSRRNSVEELWHDLVFAAQRLGFSYVKMTLADGQKVWQENGGCPPERSSVQALDGGRQGTLELKAPSCEMNPAHFQNHQTCDRSFCPCVADIRVFEIVTDLMAEGWTKAITRLQNGRPRPRPV